MDFRQKQRTIRCIVVGDSGIERENVSNKYLEEITFRDIHGNISHYNTDVEVKGEKLQLTLRDFGGEESFPSYMLSGYDYDSQRWYAGGDGQPLFDIVLLVFDMYDGNSLLNARFKWLPYIRELSKKIPIVLASMERAMNKTMIHGLLNQKLHMQLNVSHQ